MGKARTCKTEMRRGVVAIAMLAAVIAAGDVGKLPPALPLTRAEFGLHIVTAGWLASIFSAIGMLSAIVFGAVEHNARRRALSRQRHALRGGRRRGGGIICIRASVCGHAGTDRRAQRAHRASFQSRAICWPGRAGGRRVALRALGRRTIGDGGRQRADDGARAASTPARETGRGVTR